MRIDSVLGLDSQSFHRMHYTDWGDPASRRVVICVHGLTRNCRDFDFLAQALAGECRVVCPDIAGRGKSEWLSRKEDYSYPQYMADITALIARVGSAGMPALQRADLPAGRQVRVIALINDAGVVQRILKHLGLWAPRQNERAPPAFDASIEAALPADNMLTYHPVPDIA